MSNKIKLGIVAVALTVAGAACSDSAESTEDETTTTVAAEDEASASETAEAGNIVEVATEAGSFTTLLAAAEAAGLVETLSGDDELTVFAPTDDAFAAALDALGLTAEELLADTETLTSILTYHVVAGEVLSTDLADGNVPTVNGAEITVDLSDGVKINDANVVTADVDASNGVIHVIDAVLLPPAGEGEDAMEDEAAEATGNIVEVATEAGSFTTLLAAAEAADLVGTLSGDAELTVFAPTDDAFAAALEALGLTAEELLADTETLTSILTYHVVEGEVLSTDLADGPVPTVNGAEITVDLSDGVKINEANVVTADVDASNGVIHVIDGVLLP
ncbi:MAG: fasciclin domain-containing protein [Actinomycetota bacterium]